MKILMLKGLPGSGKSTWAKEFVKNNPEWVRINKDSLREMMGPWSAANETLVLRWRDYMIMEALRIRKNVIVDDTNFHPKHETRMKELIYGEQGLQDPLFLVDFEIKLFDTPLEECILRDAGRPNPVGAKVIKKMWRQYVYKKPDPLPWIIGLPAAIICDLDGTLALHNGRSPYDAEKCGTDILNYKLMELIRRYPDHALILVTGREDKYRLDTNLWLQRYEIVRQDLFMRPTGDMRSDDIIKQEIYDREIKWKYNVEFVLDDRDRVVDMWRRNGLTCLQVAEGDF